MNLMKKMKSRRGMTLIEVLVVIALMLILLGIAMPNILAEAKRIKMAEMNGNARAVAVAVQSKLYGMKNANTSSEGGSSYRDLNDTAAFDSKIILTASTPALQKEAVKYVKNFVIDGEDDENAKKVSYATSKLLSGAITDSDLLGKGKIVIFYKENTADVLEVFYSEKDFDVEKWLIPALESASLYQSDLDEREIGHFFGLGVDAPKNRVTLPHFTCGWQYDDEMYLELKMDGTPKPEILDKPLGLEVYAVIPKVGGGEGTDEIMIYAEGFFATPYVTSFAGTIAADYNETDLKDNALTLGKIASNGGYLRFAIDSMVTSKAGYGSVQTYLRHQTQPTAISAADPLLYPRESLADWFNGQRNPYLTYWLRENEVTGGAIYNNLFGAKGPTSYVGVDQGLQLRVKLNVLADPKEDPDAATRTAKGATATLYNYDNEYGSINILSQNSSPYYYALSTEEKTIVISSMRDFNNLHYIFETGKEDSINTAKLQKDIDAQQFYEKLVKVRYAAIAAMPVLVDKWGYDGNQDTCTVDSLDSVKGFTFDGSNSKTGSYKIKNIFGGGRNISAGGYFRFAQDCTFKNIDIVNPKVWRDGINKKFLLQEDSSDPNKLTGIDAKENSISGALVAVAVNCTFTNVRVYIDPNDTLYVEIEDRVVKEPILDESGKETGEYKIGLKEKDSPRGHWNIAQNRVSGMVAGGLVGLAVGDGKEASTNGGKTTFKNCAASVAVTAEFYYPSATCIYAGGLIGIAMGNVVVENSYASGQVSGYYSGGLVGATANGKVKFSDIYDNTVNGQVTLNNSFTAGRIQRLTRVGGGLIAQTNGANPQVTNCYSAAMWEALPPVAYGTFEGDENNYYIVQTQISVPVTTNVEARFSCTGDVFSKGKQSGKPCTAAQLKTTAPFSGWVGAAHTLRWSWANNSTTAPDSNTYPFPMPERNNEFWGGWIESYDTSGTTVPTPFSASCDGFFCTYMANSATGFPNDLDVGGIVAGEPFSIWKDEKGNQFVWLWGGALNEKNYWVENAETRPGQGIDGATRVAVNGDGFDFTAAKFYSPDFNPVKGYTYPLTGTDINPGIATISWDFYGFYFLADYGVNNSEKKYYIQFADDTAGEGKVTIPSGVTAVKRGDYVYVDKDAFTKAMGYSKITLSKTTAQIQYNNGYFSVNNGS